jgi:hypothetical protein
VGEWRTSGDDSITSAAKTLAIFSLQAWRTLPPICDTWVGHATRAVDPKPPEHVTTGENLMKTLLTNAMLTVALAVAAWSMPATAQADEPSAGLFPTAKSVPTTDLRLARRWWWNGRYYQVRPSWYGGGYYYDNPRLYYRQIAPGVYYYF